MNVRTANVTSDSSDQWRRTKECIGDQAHGSGTFSIKELPSLQISGRTSTSVSNISEGELDLERRRAVGFVAVDTTALAMGILTWLQ
jgi:hypothetical protein